MSYTSSPQTDEEEMLPNSSEIVSLPAAHLPLPQAGHVINYPLFIMPRAKSAAGAYLLFWALG